MLLVSRPALLPTVRRGAAFAAVSLAAAALAGCTSASSGTQASKQSKTLAGDAGAVQGVIADVAGRASSTKSDPAGICGRDLSANLQAQFAKAGGTCTKGLGKAIANTDSLQLDVKSVKVAIAGTTKTAIAQVGTPDDIGTRSIALSLAAPKARWLIDSFDATITKTAATK